MTEYQRLISYLYVYEDGTKGKNAGFAKIESRNGNYKVYLSVSFSEQFKEAGKNSEIQIYLYTREEEGIKKHYLDTIPATMLGVGNQNTVFKIIKKQEAFERPIESYAGLLICALDFLQNNDKLSLIYASEWDDISINVEEFKESFHNDLSAAYISDAEYEPEEFNVKESNAEKFEVKKSNAKNINAEELSSEELSAKELNIGKLSAKKLNAEEFKPEESNSEKSNTEGIYEVDFGMKGSERIDMDKSDAERVRMEYVDAKEAHMERVDTKEARIEKFDAGSVCMEGIDIKKSEEEESDAKKTCAENVDMVESDVEKTCAESNDMIESDVEKTCAESNDMIESDVEKTCAENSDTKDVTSVSAEFFRKLSSCYPKVQVKELGGTCIRITPHDISYLPKTYWQLCNNSFLLHGFYNYRHLILCEKQTGTKKKYILAVPGLFHQREQTMARMFGFTDFAGERKNMTMNYGYWCMYLQDL